jgi:competence protein ComEC
MALLVLGAVFVDKDVDLINVLAASAVFLLVYNPLLIGDASFQLSYAATFAIALFYKPFFRWFGFLPSLLRETAAATLAAQIGILPLQLHLFYRLSPVALVSNLLIVPASSLAIVFGLIALAVGVIHPVLGELYGAAAWFVSKVIIVTAGACADGLEPLGRLWPALAGWRPFVEYGDLQFWVGRPPLPAVLSIVAAILFFAFRARKWRLVMLASFAVLVAVTVVGEVKGLTGPPLRVTFLDVGNGDAALIEAPDGRRLLVNAGYGNEDYSAGRAKVEPFLHARGIDRLDVLCITSADAGAAGGAPYIIENVPLGELWIGRGWTGGDYYDPMPTVEDAAADVGVKTVNPGPGNFSFGGARLTTFEGDDSTSILLTYESFSLFYAGFRSPGQLRMLPGTGGPLGVTVLKAPARGTEGYGMGDSARILSPAVVVISAKRGGRPERPDPAMVGAFEQAGSRVLVTADHGSVVVETDGVNVRIRTAF